MRIIRNNDKGSLFLEAESISEMIESAVKWTGHRGSPGIEWKEADWIGHPELRGGWSAFRRIFNEPWKKGMGLLAEMQRKIRDLQLPTPVSRKRRRAFNETSGDVDVDRVMQGELACFSDPMRRDIQMPKIVRLMVPVGFHSGISAAEIAWTAVAIAAIVDLFEDSQRPVELMVAKANRYTYERGPINRFGFVGMVKNASDPLSVATLVNVMSPWFYRTVGFGMQDSQTDLTTSHSRGMPATSGDPIYTEMFDALGMPENTDLVMAPVILDQQAAEAFIREMVAKIAAE